MALLVAQLPAQAQDDYSKKMTLVIHGGAGNITRQNLSVEKEKAYKATLATALQTGFAILKKGGTSLDVVEATIRVLEDSPLFNAGRGAVFTHDGRHELDASIMDGSTLQAGAVAGVTGIRNPICTARRVLEKTEHVLLMGQGAEAFAHEQGMELVDPAYFYTETRWQALQLAISDEKAGRNLTKSGAKPKLQPAPLLPAKLAKHKATKTSWAPDPAVWATDPLIFDEGKKYGTVGCVALDQWGNLAAGTSTGGTTNKRYGRVSDSAIIGAGTYANNATCAVSATGQGEAFIRSVAGHDISALMEYKGLSVQEAADEVVLNKLAARGGEGGVIALDRSGNIAMPFTTEGMYRAYIRADGSSEVLIFEA
ncbi:isoaspartyl peptidase/L-asparaginase [Fibrella sp. HMF5036]|uniref:Isoaspartyl peptidase n=2 Tax=Fibrella aquatilis TaxID=2817059 RepID=A0A939K2R6_9BACT|nr:isoaspartyl peptidase/L-asparaginase [Fibrella aquatilis]